MKYPLKRLGERGEGKWQRISWDEALDTIGAKLKGIREEFGPLAIAAANGTARACAMYVMRFLSNLGSPNRLGHPHICSTPQWACYGLAYGRRPGPHFEESRCIAAFGSNVTHTRVRPRRTFCEGYRQGAKIICVDPYLTPIAAKADLWLQIRPGTDCAMALAWLQVIIGEGLYDREFVEKWGYGFDRLAEHVKQFTPEWAEKITWVPAAKIAEAARLYGTTKPASLVIGVAPEFGVNNAQTIRALTLLPGATGNIDVPGGNIFWFSPIGDKAKEFISASLPREELSKAVGRFPLLAIGNPTAGHAGWRSILTGEPYPLKAVLFHASNPLASDENPQGLVYQALKKVEFVSVMDFFMTPTAGMADIVLPAATWFEKDDIMAIYSGNWWSPIVAVQKAVEPLGEARDDTDVLIEITKRMGLDYGFGNKRELLDWFVEGLGINFEELAKKGWADRGQEFRRYETGLLTPDKKPGFNTPSGKVEFYSQTLEKMGFDPLPSYREPVESPYSSPDLAKEYPLILTTGTRSPVYMHSQWRQIPWLREIHPDPLVKINPQTAEALGIRDGDWVYVESPRGKCRHKALVTLGIDPRVVQTEASWWFPEQPAPEHGIWEANSNMLVNSEAPWDPGFGATSGRSLLCKIYKAEGI